MVRRASGGGAGGRGFMLNGGPPPSKQVIQWHAAPQCQRFGRVVCFMLGPDGPMVPHLGTPFYYFWNHSEKLLGPLGMLVAHLTTMWGAWGTILMIFRSYVLDFSGGEKTKNRDISIIRQMLTGYTTNTLMHTGIQRNIRRDKHT